MNDYQTSDTVQLTRIHALNWYGFSDSFDLAGQTIITGVYGCGKTALIDLVQTVLLGPPEHENRYNLSVGDIGNSGKQIKRDLRGYALQDLNITANGSRVFARQGGRTFIALEWTWPDGKRRETWGLRIEYSSVGADPDIDYWQVPCRLTPDDFTGPENGQDDVPLGAEPWIAKLSALGGTRHPAKEQYLAHLSAGQHLNFDARVFKPLLMQTLRFTFGTDFNTFCREHILPETRIDIDSVRESYDRYREFLARIQSLREQETELREIAAAFNKYQTLGEEISALGWFEQKLLVEERLAAFQKATAELEEVRKSSAAWETKFQELKARRDAARKESQELNRQLAEKPNAQEFTHYKDRQHALPKEIQQLEAVLGSPADVLRRYFERLRNLLTQAAQTADRNNWTKTPLDPDCPRELPFALDYQVIAELSPKVEHGAESQATAWKMLTDQAVAEEQGLQNKLTELRREIARLREHGTTDRLPLREALQARFGKGEVVLLGDLCEIADPIWTDALEINFGHKLATLVPDELIGTAFSVFNTLPDVSPRERLVCRADLRTLTGRVEPGSLAEKIHSDDPAISQLLAHLFGSLHCCHTISDAESRPRAILPSGAVKEPTGRRRQRATPSEYVIGRQAREATIRAKEREIQDLLAPLEAASARSRDTAQLRDGFQDVKQGLLKLRSNKIQQLRELEDKRAEQVRITSQLNQLENRDALEDIRAQARKSSEYAGALTTQIEDHLEKAPPTKASKEQAMHNARQACSDTETQALTWQAANPAALSHAAKHQHLEEEARQKATASRSPSATCEHLATHRQTDREAAKGECRLRRQKLHDHPRMTDFRDFDVGDMTDNTLWDKKLAYIIEAGIKDFTQKAQEAETEWEDRFQQNVLGQLMGMLNGIRETFRGLQQMIAGRAIGGTRYSFVHTQTERGDFNQLRDLVTNLDLHKSFLVGTDQEKIEQVRALRRDAMKLFEAPQNSDGRSLSRQRELLDPRYYFTYDMEVTEPGRSEPISLNQRGRKGSGGETYNPYLIALMTAYMRAFRRHERGSRRPSISLLLMDEAFKVNDSAAVSDCVKIISELGFQGIISCTNTVGSQVIEHFQWAMIVQKHVVPAHLTEGQKHDEITNSVFAAPKNAPDVLRLVGEPTEPE